MAQLLGWAKLKPKQNWEPGPRVGWSNCQTSLRVYQLCSKLNNLPQMQNAITKKSHLLEKGMSKLFESLSNRLMKHAISYVDPDQLSYTVHEKQSSICIIHHSTPFL